jgi:hypothetical protein
LGEHAHDGDIDRAGAAYLITTDLEARPGFRPRRVFIFVCQQKS